MIRSLGTVKFLILFCCKSSLENVHIIEGMTKSLNLRQVGPKLALVHLEFPGTSLPLAPTRVIPSVVQVENSVNITKYEENRTNVLGFITKAFSN
jgi:hypothetical protein